MYLRSLLVSTLVALLSATAAAADAPPGAPKTAGPAPGNSAPPLPGQNTISNLQLKEGPDGQWRVTYEYFYTGSPPQLVHTLWQKTSLNVSGTDWAQGGPPAPAPRRGRNVETLIVSPPPGRGGTFTKELSIVATDPQTHKVVAMAQLPAHIEWTDDATAQIDRSIAQSSPEAVVETAATIIDGGNRQMMVEAAKPTLERVVLKHPRTHSAYVELARIAMKTNWNADGLRQGEALVKSALEIAPNSSDAKIMLGYIYAYQKRFKESEPLFVQAEKAGSKNLWLWVNWGELLQLQGRPEQALAKFRQVLEHPHTSGKNGHARYQAYAVSLLMLESMPNRADEVEALMRKRVADYGRNGCPGILYAQFLLHERADAPAATRLLVDQRQGACDGMSAQELLGLAQYLAWSTSTQADLLRQARAMLPAGPKLFYELAAHQRLLPVARKLIAAGDRIDVQDQRGMDALGYALAANDIDAADQLLKLGAPVNSLQGPEKIPLALIPVLSGDVAGIRLMQKAGVDYKTLRHRGVTAFDHAKETGNETLLRALGSKAGKL